MSNKNLLYTKSQLEAIYRERLNEVIEVAEGYYHLAKMLGMHHSTIRGWLDRGRISKEGAKKVANHKELGKQFKANYLRPDL